MSNDFSPQVQLSFLLLISTLVCRTVFALIPPVCLFLETLCVYILLLIFITAEISSCSVSLNDYILAISKWLPLHGDFGTGRNAADDWRAHSLSGLGKC